MKLHEVNDQEVALPWWCNEVKTKVRWRRHWPYSFVAMVINGLRCWTKRDSLRSKVHPEAQTHRTEGLCDFSDWSSKRQTTWKLGECAVQFVLLLLGKVPVGPLEGHRREREEQSASEEREACSNELTVRHNNDNPTHNKTKGNRTYRSLYSPLLTHRGRYSVLTEFWCIWSETQRILQLTRLMEFYILIFIIREVFMHSNIKSI